MALDCLDLSDHQPSPGFGMFLVSTDPNRGVFADIVTRERTNLNALASRSLSTMELNRQHSSSPVHADYRHGRMTPGPEIYMGQRSYDPTLSQPVRTPDRDMQGWYNSIPRHKARRSTSVRPDESSTYATHDPYGSGGASKRPVSRHSSNPGRASTSV